MLSSFHRASRRSVAASKVTPDETYDLKGLNMVAPDQVMPAGESPYTINTRSYPREDDEKRVAIRTRKGSAFLSTPIGETANVSFTTAATTSIDFSDSTWVAQPFTASSTGLLTKVEIDVKRTGTAGGYVIVEIYTDVAGAPNTLMAQSSFPASSIATAAAFKAAYFMDAPTITNGTQYWIVVKLQELGVGSLQWTATDDAAALQTTNEMSSYSILNKKARYKTYTSTAGTTLGYTRRYPSSGTAHTYLAFNNGNLYEITDAGVATDIGNISASASKVRFDHVDDMMMVVDGISAAQWWDGATMANIPSAPTTPSNVIIYNNRAFFLVDNNRIEFSELYDFEDYPAVNFFYVPNPSSPDPVTGWALYQNYLVIFTKETKYIAYIGGEGISSFSLSPVVGTRGAVSQETIVVGNNGVYFMADDNQIYMFDGTGDVLISGKVEPELNSIHDKEAVRIHLYRNQLRVYYAKSPNPVQNRMLLFDGNTKQWFMDTGRLVCGSLEWKLDDNELIEFSSRTGQMFTGESGFSDMGKEIEFKYWTSYKAYGSGAAMDRIKRFRPIIRPAAANYYMYIGKDVDFLNTAELAKINISPGGTAWGDFVWGDGTTWGGHQQVLMPNVPMSGRGKFTQYRFEQTGVETPVELYGYSALVKVGRMR